MSSHKMPIFKKNLDVLLNQILIYILPINKLSSENMKKILIKPFTNDRNFCHKYKF